MCSFHFLLPRFFNAQRFPKLSVSRADKTNEFGEDGNDRYLNTTSIRLSMLIAQQGNRR